MKKNYKTVKVEEFMCENVTHTIDIDITKFREKQHEISSQISEIEEENNDSTDADIILAYCYYEVDDEIDEYIKKQMNEKVLKSIDYKLPEKYRSINWDTDDEYETNE